MGADQIGIALQTPLVLSKNRAFISLSQKLIYQLAIQESDNAQTTAQKLFNTLNKIILFL